MEKFAAYGLEAWIGGLPVLFPTCSTAFRFCNWEKECFDSFHLLRKQFSLQPLRSACKFMSITLKTRFVIEGSEILEILVD